MCLIHVTRRLVDACEITDQEAVGLARHLLQIQLREDIGMKLEDRRDRYGDQLSLTMGQPCTCRPLPHHTRRMPIRKTTATTPARRPLRYVPTACKYGSLWAQASNPKVLDACNQAVSLEPDNGVWRRSRGVARGATGDFKGAIEDLVYFVNWMRGRQKQGQKALREKEWIEALERGQNPFDTETLEALRQE